MAGAELPRCPLCLEGHPEFFRQIGTRIYLRCSTCQATIMTPQSRLSAGEERHIYELHENDPEDAGYRRFLSKLANPLTERLPPGAEGLDFGCGPGPALAGMLEEAGFAMALYDPFFHPDKASLARSYDFITCTEVVEHLHEPAEAFSLLDRLLRPGGWLGIMTCFQTDDERFDNWHYRRDPTHVVFYRQATFEWLARKYGWTLEVPVKDVVLLRKGR
ncbi:MAG: class I SAM-dependent methyltransferase [Pseudomonadota bacterium]|nr:class I SAM-dependent methyltransferase [Pseudomonadota bacterium]